MEQCGLIVIDRATGNTTPLQPYVADTTTSRPIGYFDTPTSYGFPSLLSAISPDGRYSPIMVTDVDQDYGVIDLTTGEFIQFGDVPESSLWWSPDSRRAMYLVNGHLTVYDFDTRARRTRCRPTCSRCRISSSARKLSRRRRGWPATPAPGGDRGRGVGAGVRHRLDARTRRLGTGVAIPTTAVAATSTGADGLDGADGRPQRRGQRDHCRARLDVGHRWGRRPHGGARHQRDRRAAGPRVRA